MLEIFNHQINVEIDARGSVRVAIKGSGKPVVTYNATDDVVILDTTDFSAGEYLIQYYDEDNQIIDSDTIKVKQNIMYADDDYDVRSPNKQALDAITAFLQGRATAQQRMIKVGDKEIEYSSFDELQKWKNYFEREVRKEEGKPTSIRFEKLKYVR